MQNIKSNIRGTISLNLCEYTANTMRYGRIDMVLLNNISKNIYDDIFRIIKMGIIN